MDDGKTDDLHELLPGLAAGEEEAYAALYDRCGARLYRTALGFAGDADLAEEAVQEVFAGLARARASLSGVRCLKAYLFSALRRAAAASVQRRRAEDAARGRLAQREPARTPERPGELDVELERALAALPAEQREVLLMKTDAGLTFAEIAAALAVSLNTAASRYRYALERLRAALSGERR